MSFAELKHTWKLSI